MVEKPLCESAADALLLGDAIEALKNRFVDANVAILDHYVPRASSALNALRGGGQMSNQIVKVECLLNEKSQVSPEHAGAHLTAGGAWFWLYQHGLASVSTAIAAEMGLPLEPLDWGVAQACQARYVGSEHLFPDKVPTWAQCEFHARLSDGSVIHGLFEGGKAIRDEKWLKLYFAGGRAPQEISLAGTKKERRQNAREVWKAILQGHANEVTQDLCQAQRSVVHMNDAAERATWSDDYEPGHLPDASRLGRRV